MSSAAPNYVTNYCGHCGGGIEFDAARLTANNRTIPCPHCGREIRLSIPELGEGQTEMLSKKAPLPGPKFTFAKGQGMTLTPEQAGSPEGQELVRLLLEMEEDGLVSKEEVRRLNTWLQARTDADIPAFIFLSRLSDQILKKETLTPQNAYELQMAIRRILPAELQVYVIQHRHEAWQTLPASARQLEYIRDLGGLPSGQLTRREAAILIEQLWNQPTQSQLDFIRGLGGELPKGLTRESASHLIGRLLGKDQPSPNQPGRVQMPS
jgi:hypothetical protein